MEMQLPLAQTEGPIITSLLDIDFYKFTMGQFVFHRYADVPVKYGFNNRTKKVKLAEFITEADLRKELGAVQDLRPTEAEIAFLRRQKNNGQQLFNEKYLDFFKNVRLPDYKLAKRDGQFELEFEGPWANTIYWETIALSVMNELYYRAITHGMDKQAIYAEGKRRLEDKLELLEQNPFVRFMEFGTRRRWGKDWQEYTIVQGKNRVPNQMVGTSNTYQAMKHDLIPKGTEAHELFMILAAINDGDDDSLRASHQKVLREWWDEYGAGLSIALTDTFGTKFFFEDMPQDLAEQYLGLRQDSGKPRAFANGQINFYNQRGIDPTKKVFCPSDGLDVKKIIDLQTEYRGRILQTAGWGTNYTNDLGFDSLSLVIKATEANGRGTVKLSDNPAKSMGSERNVARYQRVFGYNPAEYAAEECVY
ncbi:MAG: nicotinate phosphoribosyltransferase [archaeon]